MWARVHARRGACSGKYRGERVYACRGNRCEYAGCQVCTGCVGGVERRACACEAGARAEMSV